MPEGARNVSLTPARGSSARRGLSSRDWRLARKLTVATGKSGRLAKISSHGRHSGNFIAARGLSGPRRLPVGAMICEGIVEQIIALEGSGVLMLSIVAYCEARDALRLPGGRYSLGASKIGGLFAACLTIVLGILVCSLLAASTTPYSGYN